MASRTNTLFEQPFELIQSIDQLFDLFCASFEIDCRCVSVSTIKRMTRHITWYKEEKLKQKSKQKKSTDWLPITDQWSLYYIRKHCMCVWIRKSCARYVVVLKLRGAVLWRARLTSDLFIYFDFFLLRPQVKSVCVWAREYVCAHFIGNVSAQCAGVSVNKCWRRRCALPAARSLKLVLLPTMFVFFNTFLFDRL